ncbi:DUF1905 domain-containing protein [Terrabacter aeriphilus]|uniref:DUF1905 domain-containing protein n=1 Tax=Terrabacter aeriphilus TaxID=515662 RepID=A0ABP9J6E7_9MICO
MRTLRFTAELWRWEARAEWFFVTVDADASARIREVPRPPRGFGSVRVRATVGGTSWTTSVFPDATRGAYVLPVKRSVRVAEDLDEGDPADVVLEVLE